MERPSFDPQRTVTLAQVADWQASMARTGNVACAVNPPDPAATEPDPSKCYWVGTSRHQARLHDGDTPIRVRIGGTMRTIHGHKPRTALQAADKADDKTILAKARAERLIARSGL